MPQDNTSKGLAGLTPEECMDLFTNAPMGVFTSTPDGRFLSANPALARMLGYDSPQELVSLVKHVFLQMYADPSDRDEIMRLLQENKEVLDYECRFLCRDGSTIWTSSNVTEVRGNEGNVEYFQFFVTDITHRKNRKKIKPIPMSGANVEDDQAREALTHSYNLLRYIVEHTRSAVAVHDRDLKYIFVSQRYLDEFKVREKDVIGRHHYEVFPDLPRKWRDVHQRALQGEILSAEDDPYYRQDGTVEWTRWECRPWYEQDGSTGGIIVYTEVITERKQADEALRKSEERFRLSMEATKDGLWDWDITTGDVYFSPGYASMLGYDSTEVPPHVNSWLDLIHPEDADRAYKANLDCIENRVESFAVEFRMQARDGSWRWILGRGQAVTRDASGRATRMIGTHTEITHRKQAEEEILLNKKRIETLQELTFMTEAGENELVHFAMEAAVSLTSSSMGYVAFTDRDENNLTMYAWSSRAMQECAVKDKPLVYRLCDTGLWGEAVRQRRAVVTNDYSAPNILKKGLPNGHVQVLRHMSVPVFDGDRIIIVAGVGNKQTDYSDDDVHQLTLLMTGLWTILCRKRAEQEREKLQAQLLQAQKMESIGIMAGGIAHDFNNLLQTMSGNLEFLLQDKSPAHRDFSRLQGIARSVERSSRLVQQLLLAGRKTKFEKVYVDLNKELQDVFKILERVIPKMVAIELHLDPHIQPVAADPVQIEQVLLNLANNAVDAMPHGGRLAFETRNIVLDEAFVRMHPGVEPGNHVLLSVTDTGCGMDRDTLKKIFDPFFTTKETGKGSGLGLATAYGIVNAHDGYIQCYSEPGQGTTFKIFLPVQEADVYQSQDSAPAENARGGRETILVVDDEPEIRALTREALESLGYSAKAASSGEEALDMYKQQGKNIDLVLLDLNMPGMGGRKCLQELLQLDPGVRVLIASGYASNGLDVLHAGSRGYLGKPYQISGLAAKIREVLDDD